MKVPVLNIGPLARFDDGKPDFLHRLRQSFKDGEPLIESLRPYVNKTGEETHYNIGSLENSYMSPWLILSGPDAGKTVNTVTAAYSYVVVTDAAGRTFTTGSFSYRG